MEREKREQEKHRHKAKSGNGRSVLPKVLQNSTYQKIAILVALSLLTSFLLTSTATVTIPHYELGDVADHNIKARRDFLLEDEEATRKKREEAAQTAPVVYDLDERLVQVVKQRLDKAFEQMQKIVVEQDISTEGKGENTALQPASTATIATLQESSSISPELAQVLSQKKEYFEVQLGIHLSDETFKAIAQKRFDRSIPAKVVQLLEAVLNRGVVSEKASLLQAAGKDLITRRIQSQVEQTLYPPHYFMDLEEARRSLRILALDLAKDMDGVNTISTLASQFLQPNLTLNVSETAHRKEVEAALVKPVYIQIKRNEMLVREGQRIGPEQLLKLKAYKQRRSSSYKAAIFAMIFAFTALCYWVLAKVIKQHIRLFRMDARDLLFLSMLIVLFLAMGRFAIWITDTIGESSFYLTSRTLVYALPLSAGAMLASMFFGVTLSLIFSLTLTMFSAMLFGRDFALFLYFLIGSFVGAHVVIPCRNRMIPIRAGLLVGCANLILVVLIAILEDQWGILRIATNAMWGFWGGILAGILVAGLTPLAEMAFGYTTDVKLMELATMDQPLLQELMVQAPGTYHHSIIVGNMVETAAKSIGANPLMAKVAAYYHDIGKIKKPIYFIENQFDCENRHEKLAPSMSSLILISHVKEGVELARKNRIGKTLIDIIQQHHGTSLISFFYKKAMDAREKQQTNKGAELPPINIDDYRYPGPKPQTKEAGLVMLADVVEAACRSLSEPTPARIKGLVSKLINNIFIDGQLEECELTLKDLHQIAKCFNQILATVHHKRVEYPALPAPDAKGRVDAPGTHQRESKGERDRSSANQEDSKKDLKRLGLQ